MPDIERRRDYPDLMQRLAVLETLQNRDIDEAREWRDRFCIKIDKLIERFNVLPCDRRDSRYTSQTAQIKWLWMAITFMMAVLTKVVIWK